MNAKSRSVTTTDSHRILEIIDESISFKFIVPTQVGNNNVIIVEKQSDIELISQQSKSLLIATFSKAIDLMVAKKIIKYFPFKMPSENCFIFDEIDLAFIELVFNEPIENTMFERLREIQAKLNGKDSL
jgi:hypothetical protein